MHTNTMTACFTFAAALLCSSAVAQTRFCIGGDLDHLSSAQRTACSAKMDTVRALATSLHAPDNWHFVVVCGEQGWQDYAAFNGDANGTLADAVADTRLDQHETYFRESRLGTSAQALREAVALEIAGIRLHSGAQHAVASDASRRVAAGETRGF